MAARHGFRRPHGSLRAVGRRFDAGHVSSKGEMTQFRLNTAAMAVQLQQPIRFSESKTQEQPQVEAIRCEGGVAMDSRTFDARQQLISHDQMQVSDLGINKLGGGLTGGRGWINTVRYGSADLLPGQPNAGQQRPGQGRPTLLPAREVPEVDDRQHPVPTSDVPRSRAGDLRAGRLLGRHADDKRSQPARSQGRGGHLR